MPLIPCPECDQQISTLAKTCPYCGRPICKQSASSALSCDSDSSVNTSTSENETAPRTKKRSTLFLSLGLVLVVCIALAAYFLLPLHRSQVAFKNALQSESDLDYDSAIYYYSQVISRDADNYATASKKMVELPKYIQAAKLVAKAYIALEQTRAASEFSAISDVRVDQRAQKVTCRASNIGYAITPTSLNVEAGYSTTDVDPITGLFVTKYIPLPVYAGFQSYYVQEIRRQTSEIYYETAQVSTSSEYVSVPLAEHYWNLYKENQNLDVLEDSN